MFGFDWEFIGVSLAVVAFFLSCLWWIVQTFWGWRSQAIIAKQEKLVESITKEQLKPIIERLYSLEIDMKNSAMANVQMSQSFNSQINKILLTFAGRDSE